MTTLARRRSHPVAEILNWFDTDIPFGLRAETTPAIRIEDYVEDGTYVLRAEVPGLDVENDLEVTVTAGTLSIRGERREEEQDKHHREMRYGKFIRSVRLPEGSHADDVTARYADGVLEVRVPVDRGSTDTHTVPIVRKET